MVGRVSHPGYWLKSETAYGPLPTVFFVARTYGPTSRIPRPWRAVIHDWEDQCRHPYCECDDVVCEENLRDDLE